MAQRGHSYVAATLQDFPVDNRVQQRIICSNTKISSRHEEASILPIGRYLEFKIGGGFLQQLRIKTLAAGLLLFLAGFAQAGTVFDLSYSGAAFGNDAIASGTITLNLGAMNNPGQTDQDVTSFVTDFSLYCIGGPAQGTERSISPITMEIRPTAASISRRMAARSTSPASLSARRPSARLGARSSAPAKPAISIFSQTARIRPRLMEQAILN